MVDIHLKSLQTWQVMTYISSYLLASLLPVNCLEFSSTQ